MSNLIQRLQPYVSTFSAALKTKFQHGDTVIVGGKVTSVLNLMELVQENSEGLNKEGVYVTLDDSIGEIQLVLSPKAFFSYEKVFGTLKTGDAILAEGRVFRLDTSHSYKNKSGVKVTSDKHKTETIRVLSYQVAPLPEGEPKIEETAE